MKSGTRRKTLDSRADIAYFVVEELKAFRWRKGKPEYLIKWKDYPDTQSTWEPIEHLVYLIEDIKEFNQVKHIQLDVSDYLFTASTTDPQKRKKIDGSNSLEPNQPKIKMYIDSFNRGKDGKVSFMVSEEASNTQTKQYEIGGIELMIKRPDVIIQYFENI